MPPKKSHQKIRCAWNLIILILFFYGGTTDLFAKISVPAITSLPALPTINDQDNEKPDPQDIIQGLKMMVEAEPENYENYERLAFAYDYLQDYKNELEASKLLVKYLPADLIEGKDVYWGNLGRAYILNDQWEEGKEWLDKADKINPDNVFNRWNAFNYYLSFKKNFKMAVLELKKIDALYEDKDRDAYFEAYWKFIASLGDQKKVIKLFREAVKVDPDNPETHRALGTAIRGLPGKDFGKNVPQAIKAFKKALAVNPRHIPTYISLADTYFLVGLYNNKKELYRDALAWFDKAYQIDPENSRLAFAMGHMFVYIKEYDKAIEKLEYSLLHDPQEEAIKETLAIAYNDKAYSFYETGENLEQGISLIDKAIVLNPNDAIFLSTKAELLFKMKNYSEAYKLIKAAIKLKPDEEEIKKDMVMIEAALQEQNK